MSRRSRREERLLKEQDTVGMLRSERKDQEELAGRKKTADTRLKGSRPDGERDEEHAVRPARIARIGKPLKRPR